MTERFQLLCICFAISIANLFVAPVAAQENEVPVQKVSAQNTFVDVLTTSEEIVEPKVVESWPNEIVVESAEVVVGEQTPIEPSEAQCVRVKKSILGCMEGIMILPQDEVWLINARACVCGETDPSLFVVSKLEGSDLVPADLSDLTAAHASGDGLTTILYVHGNQTNEEFAIARGLQVYRNAVAKKAHCRQGVRYVIWAWKSEQEKPRFYPDYLVKSQRSVLLGESFAWTLNQFNDRNVVVFGYSLGVQVILSAFDSPSLLHREHDPTRYQVAFAAPAINADYVATHGLTMGGHTPVAQTIVFTNRKDRAIRAAQAIVRRRSPATNPTIAGLSDAGKLDLGAVTSIDVFEEAGRFHSIERYTRSETLQLEMVNLINAVSSNRADSQIIVE